MKLNRTKSNKREACEAENKPINRERAGKNSFEQNEQNEQAPVFSILLWLNSHGFNLGIYE